MKEKTRNTAGAVLICVSALYCLAEPGNTREVP